MHGSVLPQCQSTPFTVQMMQLWQVCTFAWVCLTTASEHSLDTLDGAAAAGMHSRVAWVCLTTVVEHTLDTPDDAAMAGMHFCEILSYHSVRAQP